MTLKTGWLKQAISKRFDRDIAESKAAIIRDELSVRDKPQ